MGLTTHVILTDNIFRCVVEMAAALKLGKQLLFVSVSLEPTSAGIDRVTTSRGGDRATIFLENVRNARL